MSDTPLLGLPYLAAAQAQKHVTHNEALSLLDGLVHLTAASRAQAAPPATPADGMRYLLPPSPTGDWAGQAGKIAFRMDGGWRFIAPVEGFRLWVADEDKLLAFTGAAWTEVGVSSVLQNLSLVGINATADATSKLTVSSAATLFTHAGAGHQIKVNKNAAGDTASLLFQTGFSGRAEFGTTGDDSFHLKVSADGAAFTDALLADPASGRIDVPVALRLVPRASDPAAPAGALWYDATLKALCLQHAEGLAALPSLAALATHHLISN